MSEDIVQIPPDGAGKKLRAIKKTVGSNEVYEEVQHSLTRGLTQVPPDKEVDKVEYTWDVNENLETAKFYDGAELLFTLTFVWDVNENLESITRS